MSKMGSFNLEVEEYVNYSISKGNSYDGIVTNVQSLFHLSDYAADELVWKLWVDSGANEEEYDRFSHGVNDMSDDGDALASAGFGTDEDYGAF